MIFRRRSMLFLAPLCMLIGCATGDVPLTIQEADDAMVTQCTFVGDFSEEGRSVRSDVARDLAKEFAMHAAQAKGATHIVWVSVTGESGRGSAHGKGYRCDSAAPASSTSG